MRECLACGSIISDYLNYCDWDCSIAFAKQKGGTAHTPNGLPISSIHADYSMWEHEHGDHPDYKFPVDVEYVGPDPNSQFAVTDGNGDPVDMGEGWVESQRIETHALIYTDGSIALTLYECTYGIFSLRDGLSISGSGWKRGEWKLTDESLKKAREARK